MTIKELFNYVIPGARTTLGYAERLLKDIPPELSARKPVVNGKMIECNHPVFLFGHLSLYPQLVSELLELPKDGAVKVPESYPGLFQIGSPCLDDLSGTIYPPLAEVSERFFSGMNAILERVPSVSQEKMDMILENPSRRERFGTYGAFITYVLLAHPQTHLGQLSSWRRCVGLGAAN
jgi:hypothetical protein